MPIVIALERPPGKQEHDEEIKDPFVLLRELQRRPFQVNSQAFAYWFLPRSRYPSKAGV
jgi:hypothetical protein